MIALLLLSLLVIGAILCFRVAYLLIFRKRYSLLAAYKGARPEQLPSLARADAFLFFALGAWLLLVPVLVVAWQVRPSAWAGLILVGSAGYFVGRRFIERKHGLVNS
jgi:hypothetical protein